MFLPLHIMPSARTGHLVGLFLASWMPIDADDAHTDFFDIWGTPFDDPRALCYARLACRWWWRIFQYHRRFSQLSCDTVVSNGCESGIGTASRAAPLSIIEGFPAIM